MAIQYIDVGIIANDGTGDDLREAFIKVNDNFDELDARIVETTVIENAGSLGTALYAGKVNGTETFKRLLAGNNVSINSNDTTVTINAADSLDQLIVVSDNGSVTVQRGQTISIQGGEVIETRTTGGNGQQIFIDLANTGIVARDTSPKLSADLDAFNKNLLNVNTVNAVTFNGELQGNVWGYDIRNFGSYFEGFDFGQFRASYTSSIQLIMQRVDVDFGAFDPELGDTVDLGYFV